MHPLGRVTNAFFWNFILVKQVWIHTTQKGSKFETKRYFFLGKRCIVGWYLLRNVHVGVIGMFLSCFTSHAIFKTLFVFWFRLFFIGEGTFWPPSFLRVPPLGKKIYICQIVDFDSSKEASWCTACNGKKKSQLLAKYGFRKNKKIKLQKLPFMAILAQNSIFLKLFLDFFRNWTLQSTDVFALHSVHQETSFELLKSNIGQFF